MPGNPPVYRLGLPAWAFPGWKDRYFSTRPSALASYASVFDIVEGNTTFYHIPDQNSVAQWRAALADSELCISFKLPRTVTHERRPDLEQLKLFFQRIAPLEESIGPILLQFPARIAPRHLPALDKLCEQLPTEHDYVLEMRHPDFFSQPEILEPLLEKFHFGRVTMDTRAIFQGNRYHPEVLNALHDKPDLPVLDTVYSKSVFVRLMLHPDIVSNEPYIREWTERTAGYISAGYTTNILIHCPNNLHCPPLAEYFHKTLMTRADMPTLEPLRSWPLPTQDSLFP